MGWDGVDGIKGTLKEVGIELCKYNKTVRKRCSCVSKAHTPVPTTPSSVHHP